MSTALATISQDDLVALEKAILEKKPVHAIAKQFGLRYADAVSAINAVRSSWVTNYADRKVLGAQLEAELDHLRGRAYAMLDAVEDEDGVLIPLSPKEKLEVIKVIGKLIEQHASMVGVGHADDEPQEKNVGGNSDLFNLDEEDFKNIAEATARALSKGRNQGSQKS